MVLKKDVANKISDKSAGSSGSTSNPPPTSLQGRPLTAVVEEHDISSENADSWSVCDGVLTESDYSIPGSDTPFGPEADDFAGQTYMYILVEHTTMYRLWKRNQSPSERA